MVEIPALATPESKVIAVALVSPRYSTELTLAKFVPLSAGMEALSNRLSMPVPPLTVLAPRALREKESPLPALPSRRREAELVASWVKESLPVPPITVWMPAFWAAASRVTAELLVSFSVPMLLTLVSALVPRLAEDAI